MKLKQKNAPKTIDPELVAMSGAYLNMHKKTMLKMDDFAVGFCLRAFMDGYYLAKEGCVIKPNLKRG